MTKALCAGTLIGLLAMTAAPGCGSSSGGTGGSGGSSTGGASDTGGSGGSAGSGGGGSGGSAGHGGTSGSGGTGGSGGTSGSGGSGGSSMGGAGGDSTGGNGGAGGGGDAGAGTGGVDAAPSTGDGPASAGGNNVTGSFTGSAPIPPLVTGVWVGKPANPAESGGGPYVYLFTAGVTCQSISGGHGWLTKLPTDTQGMELIIGTTKDGTMVPVGAAGAGKAEVNYFLGGSEHNSKSGSVTVTTYKAGMYVEGTMDVMFPFGSAKGTFHADWCPGGYEL